MAATTRTPVGGWALGALAIALVLAVGACAEPDDAGVPNPAAVYCEEQGGTITGPEPMCELPDGTVVDAWEHYRANHPRESDP